MRIGVDFDGVISDPSAMKIAYANKFWGIELTPETCTTYKASAIVQSAIEGFGKSFISKHKWDGRAEYTHLIRLLESGPALLQTKVMNNCVDVLTTLRSQGHKIVIITTLEPENAKWAYAFLKKNKVPYDHLICVPYRKDKEMKKLTKRDLTTRFKIGAFIDDSYYNMEKLSGSGIPLFLLDQPWNRHSEVKHADVTRVKGWNEFYAKLQEHLNNI